MSKKQRKIYVYDRDGNCLGSYDTIYDASVATGAKPRGIHNCLHGKQETSAGGLRFSYVDPDVLIIVGTSYPYYNLLDGSKILMDDVYFDENGYPRKKRFPDDINIIPSC